MSNPSGTPPAFSIWPSGQAQTPPMAPENTENEDGVTVRPMRLKVLYTFDDQNKTNCLARWPHVLQIQTVAMDETTSIGVIELKTCINAIVQCSPELVARLGQDYTVYAYDYSEYDNPLVGQGMLSRALSTASPTPDVPANQSRQLITGRVCKNILGIFNNGVKETLEVKLRLVPVPTMLQGEYQNTMEKYRELSKIIPAGFDANEWNSFMQSNPNLGQMAKKLSPAPSINSNMRDGMSMEVFNQLLSPHPEQQSMTDPFNQVTTAESGNEGRAPVATTEKAKKTSRPSSRVAIKRPRAKKAKATPAAGGNTSGYEEGTDGDDGPAPKKRAKVTKTNWNSNTSLGANSDSLRVAASTSGSLRLFRPIAISPNVQGAPTAASHLKEIARAPTPVPNLSNQHVPRDQMPPQRRDSFASQLQPQVREHISPYPQRQSPEEEVIRSIESAQPSPERNYSPSETIPDIGSSPPVMRTQPPSVMPSSPPCPSSPVLPQMPRTDSGFMSGSLDDLFGEDDELRPLTDNEIAMMSQEQFGRQFAPRRDQFPLEDSQFDFEEVIPGPVELLPTRMSIIEPPRQVEAKARAAMNRAGSVVSEDGQVLPPLKKGSRAPMRRTMSQSNVQTDVTVQQPPLPKSSLGPKLQELQAPKPQLQPGPTQARSQQTKSQPPEVQQASQYQGSPRFVSDPAPNSAPPLNTQKGALKQTATAPPVTGPGYPPAQKLPGSATVINSKDGQAPGSSQASAQEPRLDHAVTQKPASALAVPSVPVAVPEPAAARRPASRMVRTASMGSLTLPTIPASDPVLPPSMLQRSQTWTEAPHPESDAALLEMQRYPLPEPPPGMQLAAINGIPLSKIMAAKKATVRQKLELAIANGQMPPYCANCGAIDTPTWRKAWSKDLQGEPGYHDYSDEPGRVTTIIVLTRSKDNKPTSYKLIKKFLGADEHQEDFDEFLLCNPCGIWMSKYKTQRPEKQWESGGFRERNRGGDRKKPQQRQSKPKKSQAGMPTSEANFPPSDANFPDSEAFRPQVDGAQDGVSPIDTTGPTQQAAQSTRQRSTSARPVKRLNAMTSDAASAALRRAIQSSPARWAGTQHSPIDVEEELGSTRRVLFPSPRKDASPQVLGEVVANVVHVATEFRSPKEAMVEAQDKENCPPAVNEGDADAELVALFEEEMGKEDVPARPTTPVQNSPAPNPFKTPTRPTPSHRPVTRSVTRSGRSAKSPGQLLKFARTPSRTPGSCRRSPRHHNALFESPFTAAISQMMSEANNRTSPIHNGMELDFGTLPDLPNIGNDNNVDMNFTLEDFFSTDVPMPSSPPRFHLYEDPLAMNMNAIDWDDFGRFDPKDLRAAETDVHVKQEPEPSPAKLGAAALLGDKPVDVDEV